ncbi:hypothetical protein BASA61_002411 [Batrachochytrium salamandrivorans]|nr:hypothetical protein BASA61_002411 [Batrachochytrium salamandrivorans]
MQFTTIFIAATMAVAASATCTKDCPTTTQVDVSPPAEKTNAPLLLHLQRLQLQRLLLHPRKFDYGKTAAPSASNKTANYEDESILSGASSTALSGAVILAAVAAFF